MEIVTKEKDILREKFSKEHQKYYQVRLFKEKGFLRKQCSSCGRYFWTIDVERKVCQDQPCQFYEFLGDPPTSKKFDYIESWRRIEQFFARNGHTSVKRYPVVARWRPDLYFTVASIIDFQRVEGGKTVFEFPANPLIVPQMCLRFNDIANVGVSGRHYSSFCMIGQHSLSNSEGYWKDRTIELDFDLLTSVFGISPEEISFLEDVWVGYGAFGYSLEYFVRGLELGNAVFTAFEGNPTQYREMEERVVDMGAGLERFAWITQGTPTSYDSTFGPMMKNLIKETSVEYDASFLLRYYRQAGTIDVERFSDADSIKRKIASNLGMSFPELKRKVEPLEALYTVTDHARSLLFAIADGMLPSNVGGGFNLRVVFRRAQTLLEKMGWKLTLEDIARLHAKYLKLLYPELSENLDDIATILNVELKRYSSTKERMTKVMADLSNAKTSLSEEALMRLYDSDGITPELLKEHGMQVEVPHDFYGKVTARHITQRHEEEKKIDFDVSVLPETKPLYYENEKVVEFEGTVQAIFKDRYVVLDQTAFYPRGGGQEPDLGTINQYKVKDVEKYRGVIVHDLGKCSLRVGERVRGRIDNDRRGVITRHHTATHVVNGSARAVLGSWVWQHSAFKDVDRSRIDITHHSHLTSEEVSKIENRVNQVVRDNLPIDVEILYRTDAERKYGFRLYQGGVAPSRNIRVVKIGDFDIEACGGTHTSKTGEIGFIKIVKTERVQDGIERIEFLAGRKAVEYVQKLDSYLREVSGLLGSQKEKAVEALSRLEAEHEGLKQRQKVLTRNMLPLISKSVIDSASNIDGIKVYSISDEDLDDDYHISVGERVIEEAPNLLYVALVQVNGKVRVLVFAGKDIQKRDLKAGELAKEVASWVGGSGGGDARFGQGGGVNVDKITVASRKILDLVKGRLKV